MNLTPRQRASLARDRHLSVTANAGSGKTRVLVERYLDILLRGDADVGEVVALTFTEKAASELRKKVADRLSEELAGSTDSRVTRRLEEVREQLSGAFVGTIHSFCSRLLHEYPVEAGVDASFTVIEGLEQHTVLSEALKETFRAILREPAGHPGRDSLVDAVRRLGRGRVVGIVRMLVNRRARLERLTGGGGLYSRTDEDILREWEERIRRHVVSVLTSGAVQSAIVRVERALDGRSAGEVRPLIHALASGDPPVDTARKVFEILARLLKQDGGLYRTMASGTAEAGVAGEVRVLAAARGDVLSFAGTVFQGEDPRHRDLLVHTRTLIDVARQCLERYAARKLERGKLDFEDLLLTLRALLQKDDIRAHLASRFTFIMVDEYQDTNELQYDLLRPLVQELTSGNLFIVGDPKQSIYGFREANVAVFDRTCRDLERANPPSSEPARIVLGESFRPLRDLAAFVNLIFQPLMGRDGGEGGEYEVAYDPIVRARSNGVPGRIDLLLPGPSEGEPVAEAERVARAIRNLVESGHPVHDSAESPHPVRFADIAVLLRSRTPLPDLELALAREVIPYCVTGGAGYFQTQDILDFHSYLQFLQNPGDGVSLLGILRSPFFTVSDAEIFDAVIQGRRGSLWEDLLDRRERGMPAGRLSAALGLLQEDLQVCSRLSTPEVLSRIVARTHYPAKMSGTSRGDQAAANFEKLQRMAEAFDVQGFTTPFDFASRLRTLIDEEEEEGQGNIEAQTDAVQIMTVHAAKGLEFPVVVLPFIHRGFRYDVEPFLHEDIGLGFARIGEEGDPEDYPLTAFLRADARRKTIAEEKRIFYVACTRARDVLLLSGDPAGRSGPSWMGWLLEGLGTRGGIPRDSLSLECTTGVLQVKGEEYETVEERHRLTVGVRHPSPAGGMRALPGAGSPAVAAAPAVFADPLSPPDAGEIFSATRIRVYRECPAQYYLRYILGMPQEGLSVRGEETDELADSDFPADLRGRIFHRVMEQIDSLASSAVRAEIQRLLALETSTEGHRTAGLIDRLERLVGGVLASPFWRQVAGGSGARTEFTISAVLGDDFLSGTMDRVYRGSDGRWHVLDWKTDRVTPATIVERAEEYWPQLEFYALLVHRYFKGAPVVAELMFAEMPQQVLRREYSSGELSEVEGGIASIVSRIKSRTFPPRVQSCPRCPFAPGCPWNPRSS